jgi:hypothetical protein
MIEGIMRLLREMTEVVVGILVAMEIIEVDTADVHNSPSVVDMDTVVDNKADMAVETVIFVAVAGKDIVATTGIVVTMVTDETFKIKAAAHHDLMRLEMLL